MAGAASDGTRGAVRRRIRPLVLVAALVTGVAAIGFFVLMGWHGGHQATAAGPARVAASGCRLSESLYGYPDAYLRRALPSRKHPPLPASGWHGPAKPLTFDMLFHSVFHGYLVITYRPDLPPAARARLRAWVLAHRDRRVVGSPDATPGAPLLDFVEWGWQLRCSGVVPSIAKLDRFAARRALSS
jgi:hypothetical protein